MKKLLILALLLVPSLCFSQTLTIHDTVDAQGYDLTNTGEIQSSSSEWYHCTIFDASASDPGASGATYTEPDGSTLGGEQLDADSEYLHWAGSV